MTVSTIIRDDNGTDHNINVKYDDMFEHIVRELDAMAERIADGSPYLLARLKGEIHEAMKRAGQATARQMMNEHIAFLKG
jgi:hypothetical protein